VRVYLDHAATTPLCPEARIAMKPWLEGEFGNPSSLYEEGRRAKAALDEAREVLAERLGCLFGEVVFTGSGTEAVNLAVLGLALAHGDGPRRRILFGAAEHHCVLHCAPTLTRLGFQVEIVPVDREARTDLDALERSTGPDVLFGAFMHANNEWGTVQDATAIGEILHRHGTWYVLDAVQTLGSPENRPRMDIFPADLIAVSAHKVCGPKGVGALAVRSGVPLAPLIVGGGQEREMRGGTENVAGIVGLAAAVKAIRPDDDERRRAARDRFLALLGSAFVPSADYRRPDTLAGHAHGRFPGLSAESLLIVLDRLGVAASSGAACSSGSLEPSHVALACGWSPAEAAEALRFTFGPETTLEEAETAAERVLLAAEQVASARTIA
jgi:cysteine desulfurase